MVKEALFTLYDFFHTSSYEKGSNLLILLRNQKIRNKFKKDFKRQIDKLIKIINHVTR